MWQAALGKIGGSVGKKILMGLILNALAGKAGGVLATKGGPLVSKALGKKTGTLGKLVGQGAAKNIGNVAGGLLVGAGGVLGGVTNTIGDITTLAPMVAGHLVRTGGQGAGALIGAASQIPGRFDPTSAQQRDRWGATPMMIAGDAIGLLGQGAGTAVSAISGGVGDSLGDIGRTLQLARIRKQLEDRAHDSLTTIDAHNYDPSTKRLVEQMVRTEGQLTLPEVRK